MNVEQVSVFLENKPGHLKNVLKILGENNINIITLTIAETSDFGIIRMIVNNTQKTISLLKENKITSSLTNVLAIEIKDEPMSLYNALETFSKNNLNIEYMYAFTEKINDMGVMIFRFDDIELAKSSLNDEGYSIVKKIDLIGAQ